MLSERLREQIVPPAERTVSGRVLIWLSVPYALSADGYAGSRGVQKMPKVLIIGEKPDLVDFSDPAIPSGTNEATIRKGLDKALDDLRRKGIDADLALTTTSEAAGKEVATVLQGKAYDVIVVGAGLRVVPKMTPTFEAVINAVHEHAPRSRLAFNLSPEDSAGAAERQLSLVD